MACAARGGAARGGAAGDGVAGEAGDGVNWPAAWASLTSRPKTTADRAAGPMVSAGA